MGHLGRTEKWKETKKKNDGAKQLKWKATERWSREEGREWEINDHSQPKVKQSQMLGWLKGCCCSRCWNPPTFTSSDFGGGLKTSSNGGKSKRELPVLEELT